MKRLILIWLLIPSMAFGTDPVLWLKADALSLNDGDAVGTWTDSSGNNFSPTAAGTARPTFKTNILNSLPIVRFNGTSNKMSYAGTSGIATQADTILVVAKQTSKTTIGRFIDSTNTCRQLVGLNGGGGGTGRMELYAGTLTTGTVDRSGAFHVFSAVINGASSFGYVDGAAELSTVNPGAAPLIPTTWIGSDGTGFLNGDIAEIQVYNSALSNAERWSKESALLSKWGITAATPSPTSTPTATATATATSTPTSTATATATPSATVNRPVVCPTATATPSATSTPSATFTPTATASSTATPTATASATSTPTPTPPIESSYGFQG